MARRFFDERWIDAPVRPHKRGGAFCAYTVPSVHPYVMLNFTARRRDVLTMAHELGHGLHAALAQPQGVFHQSTPLTLAETASVFGEALVFGRMLDAAPDDDARLSLLAERIDGAVATVFRQMAMNRFEHLVHTRRRERGRAVGGAGSTSPGPSPRRSCSATRCRSPTATTAGGPMSPTSSTPPATSMPTPTGSCWRCRCTAATSRRASRSRRATWSCWPRGDHAARRSSARWSASTCPIQGSGTPAWAGGAAVGRGRGAGRPRRTPVAVPGPAGAGALLLALDDVGDQLQDLFDPRRLGVTLGERLLANRPRGPWSPAR